MTYDPSVAVIAAYDLDYGIGKCGNLPWNIPEDLRRFQRITDGQVVIMGRRTWESLPTRPLKGRINVVVSRDASYTAKGALVARNLQQALDITGGVARQFVIGGQQLFEEALPMAGYLFVTEVQGYFGCDRFFPRYGRDDWAVMTSTFEQGGRARYVDLCRKGEVIDMDAVVESAAFLRANPTFLGGGLRA